MTIENRILNIACIGSTVHLPEFAWQTEAYCVRLVIVDKGRLSDELLTFCLTRGIQFFEVDNSREMESILDRHHIDFCLMLSFGKLIHQSCIKKYKIYNIHTSLLPMYKGRHPTYWATINDEKRLGVTLHCINENIDEGVIISQYYIPYFFWENENDIIKKLFWKIPELLLDLNEYLSTGRQNICDMRSENSSYQKPVTESDYEIKYDDKFSTVFNKIRAQVKFKGAFIRSSDSKIWLKKMNFTRPVSITPNFIKNGEFLIRNENIYIGFNKEYLIKSADYYVERVV